MVQVTKHCSATQKMATISCRLVSEKMVRSNETLTLTWVCQKNTQKITLVWPFLFFNWRHHFMVRQQEGSWTKRQTLCSRNSVSKKMDDFTRAGQEKKKNGGCFLHAIQQEDGRKYHTHVCRAARRQWKWWNIPLEPVVRQPEDEGSDEMPCSCRSVSKPYEVPLEVGLVVAGLWLFCQHPGVVRPCHPLAT